MTLREWCTALGIPYVDRAGWGARPPKPGHRTPIVPRGGCTHHSVTGTRPEIAQMQAIQAFHMDGRKWSDYAYSVGVGQSGTVYEGRSAEALPYGLLCRSGGTGDPEDGFLLSVCAIGNFQGVDVPSAALLRSLGAVYGWLHDIHGAPEQYGDRDFNASACLPLDTTEVLTKCGWRGLAEVTCSDEVASWSADSGVISFGHPTRIVPPRSDAVVTVGGGLEATRDHRLYLSSDIRLRPWKVELAGDVVGCWRHIPVAGSYASTGAPLSDTEIRLLAWVQGDGHLGIKDGRFDRVSFHLARPRKIARLSEVAAQLQDEVPGITFAVRSHADGTTGIDLYGVRPLAAVLDRWLPGKTFSWDLLEMSSPQVAVFIDELLGVDGCRSNGRFDSTNRETIDFLQALCHLNEIDAKKMKALEPKSSTRRTLYSIHIDGGRKVHSVFYRKQPCAPIARETVVGCLTTENDTIVIRQEGRVFIVGNCPGDDLYQHIPFPLVSPEPPSPVDTGAAWLTTVEV